MRIGMFADAYTPDINGVVSSIVTLQRSLESLGHEVFVVTTKPSTLTDEQVQQEEKDGHIFRLPGIELKSLYGYVLTSPFHYHALEVIKSWNLDVIHVHTEFGVGIFARIVSNKLGIPIVSTYHTMYEDYTHYINVFNLKTVENIAKKATYSLSKLYGDKCTALIVPSEKTKERLEFYGIRKKINVIPTGLNLQEFYPNESRRAEVDNVRKEFGIRPDQFLLVYVGRIAEEKSIDVILDGFAEVKKRTDAIRLMVVGGGPQLDDLRQLAKSLQIDDVVTFTDKRPHEMVPIYYQAADAFVSASLSETQGMTFIEALSSGLAVFARPDDVLEGLVIEGKTGFLFKNSKEFADKLIAYSHMSKADRELIGKQAMEQVKCYDFTVFGNNVLEVYKHAIDIYQKDYVITHVKMKNDLVEMTLLSNDVEHKVTLTLDRYMDGKYHKDMVLYQDDLDELMSHEQYALAYAACVKKIASKDRTKKEIYDYLTNETTLEIKEINDLVDTLEQKNLINDQRYMMSQIEVMQALKVGRNKIVHTLVKKGIPQQNIEQVLEQESDEQEVQRGLKWAEKKQISIHDKSLKEKKRILYQHLMQQGYSKEVCSEILERMSFTLDEEKELGTLTHLAQKARQRYEKKYTGTQLRNTVFRFLVSKGFEYDDIYRVLDGMEWDDED